MCRWDNGVIIVDENVSISEPYKIDNVSGDDEKNVASVKEFVGWSDTAVIYRWDWWTNIDLFDEDIY